MIFIDSNQLMISNLFALYKGSVDSCGLDKIRYAFCRGIYWYYRTYNSTYGRMVLCYDSDKYWRKDVFPHYKATRKRQRNKSGIDWSVIGDLFTQVREEMQEQVPMIQICVSGSEADDQIAVLTRHSSGQENVIVSSDKDFQQLHSIPGLKQYSPAHREFIECEDPKSYLTEHIIKGDPSDGIPNVLSDDDTMVNPDKKQKIMNKKRMNHILTTPVEDLEEELARCYNRNRTLIDFDMIPESISQSIVADYERQLNSYESGDFFPRLINYLGDHRIMSIVNEADAVLNFDE
jgi:hypothetical protein